jgi:hypothetical protein
VSTLGSREIRAALITAESEKVEMVGLLTPLEAPRHVQEIDKTGVAVT